MGEFRVTLHAAQRYQERVRPALDVRQAGDELARLLAAFGRRVAWEAAAEANADHCFEVAPGILVPCKTHGAVSVATTVLLDAVPLSVVRERRAGKRKRRGRGRMTRYEREAFGRPRND